ncbi:MAG: hypothetical protein DRP79_01020 [Planctomycetota bacterium]|nr:MAG: hypothetical protein DRP79_01020 [Planctomycetota bacterium]
MSKPARKSKKRASSRPRDGKIYSLEVSLLKGWITEEFARKNKEVSRTIEIRGDQTLHDLHNVIFDAFDRFDEHLYEFQFGEKPRDRGAVRYGRPEVPEMDYEDASAAAVGALGLAVGDVFFYWFDFGDDWWHQIKVLAIGEKPRKGKYPRIISRVGESPPQYPPLDEED